MEIFNLGEYYVWADNRIIDFLVTITNNELIDRKVIEKKNDQDGRDEDKIRIERTLKKSG